MSEVTVACAGMYVRTSDMTRPMVSARSTDASSGERGRAKIERLSMILEARTACSDTVRRVISSLPGASGLPFFMASSRS